MRGWLCEPLAQPFSAGRTFRSATASIAVQLARWRIGRLAVRICIGSTTLCQNMRTTQMYGSQTSASTIRGSALRRQPTGISSNGHTLVAVNRSSCGLGWKLSV
jgi:hypothetical protein